MAEVSGWMELEASADGQVLIELRLGDERFVTRAPRPTSPDDLLPWRVELRLREWRSQRKASRWFGLRVCEELRALPWAAALQAVLDDDPIAWVVPGRPARISAPVAVEALRLLVAIWVDPSLPGLKKELDSLAVLGDRGIQAMVALNPTGDHLRDRLEGGQPAVLHLAPTAAAEGPEAGLRYRDESSGEWQTIPAAALVSWLPEAVRLVVINTCYATTVAQQITHARGVMTVAWAQVVSDARAVAFALFFYEQLLRGTSPADAVLMFTEHSVTSDMEHRDIGSARNVATITQNPVVFISDPADLGLEIVSPSGRSSSASAPGRGALSDAGVAPIGPEAGPSPSPPPSPSPRGQAPIEFEVRDAINPALLVNGKETLKVINIRSEQHVARAVIEVTCDAGVGSSVVRRTIELIPGLTPVSGSDFQFPVLYELLRLGVKRRAINFCVRVLAGDSVLAEETRSSWWMAQDEWIDSPDTHEFLPAFIDPETQVVKDLWSSAHQVIVALTGTSSLDGESASATDRVAPYVKALYLTLQGKQLKYLQRPSGSLGPVGRRMTGQRVRLPAEVIKDQRGTCHDLALLFAACMEHIRLYPLVILIPRHTLVGYWRSSQVHKAYWKHPLKWQIRHKQDLKRLILDDEVVLFEATGVTESAPLSFERACQRGSEQLDDATTLDAAIDVRASRGYIDTLQ